MLETQQPSRNPALHHRLRIVVLVALTLGAFAAVAGQSSADVATVSGSAYGASGFVDFGPNHADLVPTPSVTLPASGATLPVTATAPSSFIAPNGFIIFQSGALNVSTQGTIGPGGSSTSTASVASPALAGLTATSVSATCNAAEAGITGSTTVTGGRIVFADPDDTRSGEPGENIVVVPLTPSAGLEFSGPVENTPDSFRVVFNEQVVTAGSITVNAMHIFLLGPNATGQVIVGQAHCDFTATPATTSTTQAPVTTTTAAPVTTSTTQVPVTTSTTAVPVTTSTTQVPVTTSTTAAPVTTSTTAVPATTSTTAAPVTTTTTTLVVQPIVPVVRVTGDVTVTEPVGGSTPATFTVSLDDPSTSAVSVNYATTGGTAAAGADYLASSGTLVFDPGQTTISVLVEVLADSVVEPDETFTLTLSNPVGASLGQVSAVATIVPGVSPADPFTYECVAPTDITTDTAALHAATTDPGVTGASFILSREGTAVGSPIAVPGVGPFSAPVTGLDPATTYTYTTTFEPGARPQSNTACSFTTASLLVLPPVVPPPAPGPAAAVPLAPQPAGASPTVGDSGGTSGGTASSPSAGGAVTRSPLARTGALIMSQVGTALLLLLVGVGLAFAARQRSVNRARARRSQP
ncbi:MAG TPA: Calx-beta domain-containing protein [Acidimicrobiales bacterium]|nr:Calx-beta domain-containing protein [Acidimicrobiales bacterium]